MNMLPYEDNCPSCETGAVALCDWGSHRAYGFFSDGGFADYICVRNVKDVFVVPEGLSLDEAAVCTCATLTAYGVATQLTDSIERVIQLKRKASVLVVGLGSVALSVVQFVRHFWGDDVTICTISSKGSKTEKEKLIKGKEYGADKCLTWDRSGSPEDAIAMVKKEAGTFDGVCDFVTSDESGKRILPLLNKGATWLMLGTAGGKVSFAHTDVLWNEIRIQGHLVSKREKLKDVLQLLADKKIKCIPITSYKFDQLPKALDDVGSGRILGRAVINMDN